MITPIKPGSAGARMLALKAALLASTLILPVHVSFAQETTLDRITARDDSNTPADGEVDKKKQTTAGPVDGYKAETADSATRTRTPLRQLPQSVSVVPQSVIRDQGNLGVSEAIANSATTTGNANVSSPGFDTSLVRGFRADTWVDGNTTFYNGGDRESLVNVERVEILKGPSGLLEGGGVGSPVGGAINLISKMPTPERFAIVGATIGTGPMAKPFFDINQPFSENVLLRVTGEYTYREYDINVLKTQSYNINPTLTLKGEDTTLTIKGKFSRWQQPEYQGLPAVGTITGGFRINPDLFIGPVNPPESFSQVNSVTAKLEHRFNENWSFDASARFSATRFREMTHSFVGADGFAGNVPLLPPSTWGLVNIDLYQEQEELSLGTNLYGKFETEHSRHQLAMGLYYSRLSDDFFMDFAFLPDVFDPTNPVVPVWTPPGPGILSSFSNNIAYGGYVQLQSDFGERLHFIGGVRLATVDLTAYSTFRSKETRLLPRLGISYDLTDSLTAFAGYSEGMRGVPGVFYVGAPAPELSRQFEAGLKFDTKAGLSGSIAAYQIDRRNVAVLDPADPFARSIPAGVQRSRGIDVDAVWQPNPNLSLLASYSYNDTRNLNTIGGFVAGNYVPGVAQHKARLWANYRFDDRFEGWSAGIGATLSDGVFIDAANQFKTDPFVTVDANIAYETERFNASLLLKNIFNERHWERYDYFGGRVKQSEGFGAFLSMSTKF